MDGEWWGVSGGAPTAATSSTARMIPPVTAPRERASCTRTSPHGERREDGRSRALGSLVADAGIEVCIGNIHQQIHQNVHDRHEQDGPLYQRDVLIENRVHQQLADTE